MAQSTAKRLQLMANAKKQSLKRHAARHHMLLGFELFLQAVVKMATAYEARPQ